MMPKTTVLIALYNSEKYIKKTIESVLNQNFTDFELLIINDCSTDSSVQIVNEFNDARIRLLHNEVNLGIRATRQKGLNNARGKYFAILDSDDLAKPNRLEVQVNFLEINPEISLCGSNASLIDSEGNQLNKIISHNFANDIIKIEMLFGNQFINSTVLYRADLAKEIGGYDGLSVAEDYDFFSRFIQNYNVANINENLISYREHAQGDSKTKLSKYNEAEILILKFLYRKFELNDTLITVPHSLFTGNFQELDAKNVSLFFSAILNRNDMDEFFNKKLFNGIVFQKWKIIAIKSKNKNIVKEFIKSTLFSFSKNTFKENSKLIKILIKRTH